MIPMKKGMFDAPRGRDVLEISCDAKGRFSGLFADAIGFVEKNQCLRRDLWIRFVEQFRVRTDSTNHGWRGEYWGKMMRGAAWVCGYTGDAELFGILKESVRDMMSTADGDGRISSYTRETEYNGWDLWARKYVLLGMQYFMEICPDEDFNREITACMCRQLDRIIEKIGDGEGKKKLGETSKHWFGINSGSILEPVVRLYNLTGYKRYLEFADYLVSVGCAGEGGGNLFEMAWEDKLAPYEYPVVKAYEMMSCFEGLAEYYRVTGIEKYLVALVNFGRRVRETDITVIGCSGCKHELFDHSAVMQTSGYYPGVMQETCVSVTWMKLCRQLLSLTGDSAYADCIEQTFYNVYLGSFNTRGNVSYQESVDNSVNPECLPIPQVLPFDSYSPLLPGIRGKKVGGYQIMSDRSFYGCCACIGAAGVGLLPKCAVMRSRDGIAVEQYFPGTVALTTPSGQELTLLTETRYPFDGRILITLKLESAEAFGIRLRIPAWSEKTVLMKNGQPIGVTEGHTFLDGEWQDGDVLELSFDFRVRCVLPPSDAENGGDYVAFRYGPLMLASDVRLGRSPDAPVDVLCDENGYVQDSEIVPCPEIPEARLALRLGERDGHSVRLVNYFSAGKTWDETSRMAVWLKKRTQSDSL